MNDASDHPAAPERVPCGVGGLDTILGGGFFKAGIYIVAGSPGAGKTTFGNQACFHHVRRGGRAVYVTLLSETHGRMLSQMQTMSFFDRAAIGSSILYVNGFSSVESGGLDGLLALLRRTVRDHRADLLVLDGMVTASVLAKSSTDYKKFINELQTWVGVIGSTVLFLTSAGPDARFEPEYTMVDGIFELGARRLGMRWHRQLSVLKFRGSGFAEGAHPYVITNDGLVVYPRVEAQLGRTVLERTGRERIGSGVARLDELVGGGLARGSTTLLLGSSGGGKTTLGLHFLAEGATRGEPGLHFGFYENPSDLVRKADRLGLGFGPHVEAGRIRLVWQPPAERILDALAYQMLDAVRAHGAKRLVIDGLVGFKEAFYPERLPGYFSVLTGELGALGVTTLITEETRELFVQAVDAPAVSAIFDNVLLLRQLETGGELVRILSILKTRDSGHDRRLYKIDVTDGGLVVGARLAPGVGPAPPDLPRGSGGGGPGH